MLLRTFFVALIGSIGVVELVTAARRFAVSDRLRSTRRSRILPNGLRQPLARALDAAALPVTPEQAVQMWLLTAATAGLVAFGLAPATGVIAVLGVIIGGPVALRVLRHRRERLVAAAVPDALEQIGSELRSGGTIATALSSVASGDGPLAPDVTRVETRVGLGATLSDALAAWARERRAFGIEVTAGAIALSSTVGGPAADALDGLAMSLRDRLSVVAEAHALSAQARYSAWVIGVAPIGYLVVSAVIDPRSIRVLTSTPAGQVCVMLALGLEVLGGLWIRAILRTGDPA